MTDGPGERPEPSEADLQSLVRTVRETARSRRGECPYDQVNCRGTRRDARFAQRQARFAQRQARLTQRQARFAQRQARLTQRQARFTQRQARFTQPETGPDHPALARRSSRFVTLSSASRASTKGGLRRSRNTRLFRARPIGVPSCFSARIRGNARRSSCRSLSWRWPASLPACRHRR
jgi:hypothetical protein